jgi:hypothetical protein
MSEAQVRELAGAVKKHMVAPCDCNRHGLQAMMECLAGRQLLGNIHQVLLLVLNDDTPFQLSRFLEHCATLDDEGRPKPR